MNQVEKMEKELKQMQYDYYQFATKLNVVIWKPVDGFSNYEVSNFGHVRNITTGKILKNKVNKRRGYAYVNLWKNSKSASKTVHRLVATAYIPNIKNTKNVDHINNNKTDNHATNLRWATTSENAMNQKLSTANTSGHKGVSYDKRRNKWAVQIILNGKKIYLGRFDDIADAVHARKKKAEELFGKFINQCEI